MNTTRRLRDGASWIAAALVIGGCGAAGDGAVGPASTVPAPSSAASADAAPTVESAAPSASSASSAAPVARTGPGGCVLPREVQNVERWPELDVSIGSTALASAAAPLEERDWSKARNELEAGLKGLAADAPVDVRLAGHALLGRVCTKLDDASCAAKAYDAVLTAWRGTTTTAIEDAAGTDLSLGRVRTNRVAAVQRAHLAVGEALFFGADEKRKTLAKFPMPAFDAEYAPEAELTAYVDGKLTPWATAQEARIDDIAAAYHAIEDLSPAPARWVVPARARVAVMRAKHFAAFRASPVPKMWRQNGPANEIENWEDIRARYYAAIDRVAAPYGEHLKEAFDACTEAAAAAGSTGAYAQACDKWLTANANVCERPAPPTEPKRSKMRRPIEIPEF